MFGSTMGELRLDYVDEKGVRIQLFHHADGSDNAWKEYKLTLYAETFRYQVRYTLITKNC